MQTDHGSLGCESRSVAIQTNHCSSTSCAVQAGDDSIGLESQRVGVRTSCEELYTHEQRPFGEVDCLVCYKTEARYTNELYKMSLFVLAISFFQHFIHDMPFLVHWADK